jgi:hypothetical protein
MDATSRGQFGTCVFSECPLVNIVVITHVTSHLDLPNRALPFRTLPDPSMPAATCPTLTRPDTPDRACDAHPRQTAPLQPYPRLPCLTVTRLD